MPQPNAETHLALPSDITHGAAAPNGDDVGHSIFQDSYAFLSGFQASAQATAKGAAAIEKDPSVLDVPPLYPEPKNENPLTDALSFAGGVTSGIMAGSITRSLLAEVGVAGAEMALGPEILVGVGVAAAVGLGLKIYGDVISLSMDYTTRKMMEKQKTLG